jgi:uncharacterized membrane protein
MSIERLIGWLLGSILLAIPLWRIFNRTGQNPFNALWTLVPGIGPMIAALVFGRGYWSNHPGR